ncbi:hypothetical protein KYD98_12835 [Clostridium sp. YB-6]|uniref:Cell wall-binding protein n=2 Tax=Clostridium weizhouense TaxID=2859781 RepID=A0ABS7AQU0_9CLOT|nr:hypothetical protein [Clostridium weizhouense]
MQNKKIIIITKGNNMATDKMFVVGGIIAVIVVSGCAAGGAILASNMQTKNVESEPVQSTAPVKEKLNGWQQKGDNWYYYKDDKEQSGWLQDKNSWYYLGNDGKMRSGWIQDQENWYYLNSDGTMATNTTIDGCYLNEKGLIKETPKPKKIEESNKTSDKVNNGVTNAEEALNLIYSNDKVNSQLTSQGICTKEQINPELKKYFQGFQLNESVYVFYLYDMDTGDAVCIYYVGKDTGNVYKRKGGYHQLDDAVLIKNNQEIKTYKWIDPWANR